MRRMVCWVIDNVAATDSGCGDAAAEVAWWGVVMVMMCAKVRRQTSDVVRQPRKAWMIKDMKNLWL